MDYQEEQQIEVEALESIYPNEFQLISSNPYVISIDVKSENYDSGEGLACALKFTFTPRYPEEVPEIEIDDEEESNNLDENDVQTLKDLLIKEAEANTGMAMIFTLVSSATEWLNVEWDRKVKEREEEEERRRIADEEAEQQRFEGTRVTVQTFIAWKTTFDAELKRKRELESDKQRDSDSKKLTGRELFMQDKTLIESDLQFTEDDGDTLPIDESLFEDLDDLDIEDEEDDDEEDEDD